MCVRGEQRSIWPEVLWAQCPLVELFICLWRWPYNVVNVVTLTSSNAAQWASCKWFKSSVCPPLGKKWRKEKGRKTRPILPEVCLAPMPTAQQGSISFQQTRFFCCCFMSNMVSGWMSQSSEHRENYMEKKHHGCMPPNCGLWKQHHHFFSVISLLMFMLPKLVVHPPLQGPWFEGDFPLSHCPLFPGMSPWMESKLYSSFPFFHLHGIL